jgi:hypothetical protein
MINCSNTIPQPVLVSPGKHQATVVEFFYVTATDATSRDTTLAGLYVSGIHKLIIHPPALDSKY